MAMLLPCFQIKRMNLPTLLILITIILSYHTLPGQPVTFSNQTSLLNLASAFTPYSDCALDMNGDLLDDIVRIGNKGIYIDFQQPDGTFAQQFFNMPVQSPPSWSICAGDLDNNGFNDLLFADSATVSFVKAGNDGSFYTETVMPGNIFSQRSTLADINNDGWLDGFVCNDTGQSIPYRNNGAGNMSPDQNLIPTAGLPGNYAAIWTDYDNDGDIDLYITKCLGGAPPSNISRTNLLYRNNADGTFSEVGASAGLDDNAQSWSTVFEDFDNDGDFDAFIVNHDFQNRLFRNNGNATFTDVIAASGINPNDLGAWENASGDFNNDGFMDIFSELSQELYLGNGDLTFTGQDAPVKPGAIADLNGDGFLDVYRKGQLWLNESNSNHWLKVVPLGIESNRNGIGARMEIFGAWGIQVREVRSGQSFSPMNSLTVHFGLGQNEAVDSLKIRWPSGTVTTLQNLPADSTYLVPEALCLLPPAVLTVSGSTSICPGDTVELLAPSSFSNYVWSNNQTGQALQVRNEGRFFALLTDSQGCVALTQAVEIQWIDENIPAIFSPLGNTVCQGDTLVLTASSGENYNWSNSATGVSSIAITESGSYTVATDALCVQGQVVSAPFEVKVLQAPPPTVDAMTIDQGDSILLTATGENCHWYDQPAGGNLLAIGPDFQTPALDSDTAFYVESRFFYPGENQQGGKPDTSGAGGISTQTGFLYFKAWSPFTLLSVTVYVPPGAPLNNRFVQLWSLDTLLAVKQFPVQTGMNVLDLNFEVPAGEFNLRCQQGNLFRNAGPLNYPYPIGDVGEITTSSFGENFYYYFYDWQIRKPDFECVSERTAANVIVTNTYEQANGPGLTVFPNPSGELFFIEIKGNTAGATLFRLLDAGGREVKKQALGNVSSFQLDLDKLTAGYYLLQVFGDNFFETKALIKR